MKVLNLGSSGQIGAYLTEYLRKKGHEVIEYDKNLGAQYNLTAIPSTWLESCICLLYTSPSPRDLSTSRMPSSA